MKKFYVALALAGLAFPSVAAASTADTESHLSSSPAFLKDNPARQNLIGEVTAVEAGRITVKTTTGSVTVATGENSVFRRVPPGQSSLTNA